VTTAQPACSFDMFEPFVDVGVVNMSTC